MASCGLSVGHSVTTAFVCCMDHQLQDGLLRQGRRPLVGLDAALICGTSLSSRADPLLLLGCASGLHGTVAVSKASGGLLDISFAGARAPWAAAERAFEGLAGWTEGAAAAPCRAGGVPRGRRWRRALRAWLPPRHCCCCCCCRRQYEG